MEVSSIMRSNHLTLALENSMATMSVTFAVHAVLSTAPNTATLQRGFHEHIPQGLPEPTTPGGFHEHILQGLPELLPRKVGSGHRLPLFF